LKAKGETKYVSSKSFIRENKIFIFTKVSFSFLYWLRLSAHRKGISSKNVTFHKGSTIKLYILQVVWEVWQKRVSLHKSRYCDWHITVEKQEMDQSFQTLLR